MVSGQRAGRAPDRLPSCHHEAADGSGLRLGPGRWAGRGPGCAARPPHRDMEAGHSVVFLMESNPRGLYIFSFNLGHFVSLSENIT